MSVYYEVANEWLRIVPYGATAPQIAHCVNAITEWNWRAGYSFAHIVLGDYNLDNDDINYCLNHVSVYGVARPITKREYDALTPYDRGVYDDSVELRDTTLSLLRWLLLTPEKSRDDAWIILDGYDLMSPEEIVDAVTAQEVREYKERKQCKS